MPCQMKDYGINHGNLIEEKPRNFAQNVKGNGLKRLIFVGFVG